MKNLHFHKGVCVCVCSGGGSLVQFDTIDENLGTLML